ncbi:MAG: DUF5681 domain-containing protein [Proteobacteria bacterium]|nr:DUF5681 domain-containing protein [Pseudomonadota bacterium]
MTGTGPESTRFRKGQSGNPKGRPRKESANGKSAFDIVIDRTLTMTQNGRSREASVDEALQHKTYLDAVAGDPAARREILKMIAKREKAITAKAPRAPTVKVITEAWDPRNADEALLILGVAARDTREEAPPADQGEPLMLEPWAVEAALARRAARRLSIEDINEARRCTRYADSLRWPAPVEE